MSSEAAKQQYRVAVRQMHTEMIRLYWGTLARDMVNGVERTEIAGVEAIDRIGIYAEELERRELLANKGEENDQHTNESGSSSGECLRA